VKVGDLVKMKRGYSIPGIVVKIDKDFYGARQAFKIYKNVPRGKGIRSNMVDGFGPTKDGIRDRVMIIWPDFGFTYEPSDKLRLINESW
jgi:hypothetical protein